jgi:AraC-like DNA-binding protein
MSRQPLPTALASMTRGILRWAEGQGIAPDNLLGAGGDEQLERAGDSGRVPLELHDAVWGRLEKVLADPSFGLKSASSILEVSSLGVVGLLAMTSSTVGDSIARSVKYSRMLKDDASFRMSVTNDELVIELRTSAPPRRAIADASLYAFRHFGERWSGERVIPRAVFFRYSRPTDTAEYERFECPVYFEHAVEAIAFDREVSTVPLLTAQPEVARYLEMTADVALATQIVESGELKDRVMTAIREGLAEGHADVRDVARELGMSGRTLQRALAHEHLSFRQVLDEVRWSIAARLVAASDLPLEQIAERVGYADGKAFRRAFRRWAGVAPVELRRNGISRK